MGASVLAIVWLLGPGRAIVDAIVGPASDEFGPLTWLDDAAVAPEDAFVRMVTAIGLVLAVRLAVGVLLALASWIPGPTAAGAARLGRYLAPPLARGFIDVIVGLSLTSGAGVALSAPAFAATAPASPSASAVPTPVLAPPEATLQTWPDLGRPGLDLPTSTSPAAKSNPPTWPDLGRPGTDVPSSPAPRPSATRQPAKTTRSQPPAASPADSPASARPSPRPESTTAPATAAHQPEIVVAPGDCLWTLAARDLQDGGQVDPSAADIAAATDEWWQANRTAIGPDPDRLQPGQLLQPPR